MYYKDMSPYSNSKVQWRRWTWRPRPKMVNIGWLSDGCQFIPSFDNYRWLPTLVDLCKYRFNATLGTFCCPFCDVGTQDVSGYTIEAINEKTLFLGNAEIWIPANQDLVLVAPNLIVHYINRHGYRPPQTFDAALEKVSSADVEQLKLSVVN